jgi:hypothetical protein
MFAHMRCVWLAMLVLGCGGSPAVAPDGGGGGGGDSGGGGDRGGGGPETRLSPLEVGRTWTYDITSTYASCPAGRHDMRVVSAGTTDGRAAFEVASFCGPTGHTSVTGNIVEDYYDWGPVGWTRQLDEPVEAGHTWMTTNGSATFGMTYSNEGSAGGFSDCWRVTQQVSYTSYWIYCRGVGLVTFDLVDLGGGTIHAELASKSF